MAGIQLRSPSFGDHQPIPTRHAKDHDNLSPALEWSGASAGDLRRALGGKELASGTLVGTYQR